MKPFERRLRALEARANVKGLQPVPHIIVRVGETMEEVLAREGVVPVKGQRVTLVVRQMVAPKPKPEAAEVVTAGQGVGNGVDASE